MLRTTIADLTKADTLTDTTRKLWNEFQPPGRRSRRRSAAPKPADEAAAFQEFRKALAGKDNLDQLDHAVAEAFARWSSTACWPIRCGLSRISTRRRSSSIRTERGSTARGGSQRSAIDPEAISGSWPRVSRRKRIADRIYAWLEPRLLHPSTPLTTLTLRRSRQQKGPG